MRFIVIRIRRRGATARRSPCLFAQVGGMMLVVVGFCVCSSTIAAEGIASKYVKEIGIEKDPAVIFSDDFEAKDVEKRWDQKRGPWAVVEERPNNGARSIAMPMHR